MAEQDIGTLPHIICSVPCRSSSNPVHMGIGVLGADIATEFVNKRKSNLFYRFYYLNIGNITFAEYPQPRHHHHQTSWN